MQFAIIFCLVAVAALAAAGPVRETSTPSQLLRHEETHSDDGYDVQFELADGTLVKDHGVTAEIIVDGEKETIVRRTGSYRYTSPEGELIEVHYTADENGFQAEGAHLPKVVKA